MWLAGQIRYNSVDQITQVTKIPKPGSSLANIVTSYTYDSVWNKIETFVDGLSNTTTYSYDSVTGNLLSIQRPSVGGFSPTQSMTWNSRGQISTVSDPVGIVTKYNYDSTTENLLSRINDFGVGRLNLTVTMGYDNVGNVTSIQDPVGNTKTIVFDVLRRITQTIEPAPFSYLINFAYDSNSNLISASRQSDSQPTPWQSASGTYTVDNLPSTVMGESGEITSFAYNSLRLPWKIIDALGRTVIRGYDDATRLHTVTDPTSTVSATIDYHPNNLTKSIEDRAGNITLYDYDGFDRLTKVTYPDSTYADVTSFDSNDCPLVLRTCSGDLINYSYDSLNRTITKSFTGQPTVSYTYDLAGKRTSVSTPAVVGDPSSGTHQFFFDSAGRCNKEQYPDGKIVVSELDACGRTIKTTYPDGTFFVERFYDELGRVTDIKINGATSSAVQFSYDKLSRRTKIAFENGVNSNYVGGASNNLTSLTHMFVGSTVSYTYGFDSVSRMATQQVSDSQFSWHPAAAGTMTYGTADSTNKYPTVNGNSCTYDGNGCLTSDGIWSYSYTIESLLKTASKVGTSVTFSYDPLLRQRQKNVLGGAKTDFYYDGWKRLADYDGATNTLLNNYVYGCSLDEVLISVDSSGTRTYHHADHIGSIVATTNASGAVVNRFAYSPFGESTSVTSSMHGYTGQRFDSEIGLYYYKARYYSPSLGRFLQPDPVGYLDGLNQYSYTGNNPLNSIDPMGLSGISPLKATVYFGETIELTYSGMHGSQTTWYGGHEYTAYPDFSTWISGQYSMLDPLTILQGGGNDYIGKYGVIQVMRYLISIGASIIGTEYGLARFTGEREPVHHGAPGEVDDVFDIAYADIKYRTADGELRYAEVKTSIKGLPTIKELEREQRAVYTAISNGGGYTWNIPRNVRRVDVPEDGKIPRQSDERVQLIRDPVPVDFFFVEAPVVSLKYVGPGSGG